MNSLKTFSIYSLLILVFNLPSEYVPAPPSPNWIFELGLRILVFKKLSVVMFLLSTSSPLSKTMGIYPNSANLKAEKSPAGPVPTTAISLLG